MVVVDAVVHPYNLAPGNQNPAAREQLETVYAAHCLFAGMRQYICDVLKELPGVTSVEVRQTRDELWTPDRIERKSPGE